MKIKELLDSPEKWSRGASARDEHQDPVNSNSPKARSWCLMGAMTRCANNDEQLNELWGKIQTWIDKKTLRCNSVSVWNDEATFPQIREMLEELDI